MTEAEALDYIEQVVRELDAHRPELLATRHGRWVGPKHDVRWPAGLWFYGPNHKGFRLKLCVSPWDTDAGLWLHVSVSHQVRDPTYREMLEVRQRFFRPDDTVLHVLPPAAEHFSMHEHCLHLWTPIDGSRPIPDLRGRGGGV